MKYKYLLNAKRTDDHAQVTHDDGYQESAASVTELEPYKYGKNSSKYDQEKKKRWSKIILTGVSAIIIGVIFGTVLLVIISYEAELPVTQDLAQHPTSEVSEPDAVNQAYQIVELPTLSGYVIQAGVFQGIEQAEWTQETIAEQGYSSLIWPTDTDYRVFLGVYPNEAEAKQVGQQLSDSGLDVYARQWQSNEGSVNILTKDEETWLTEFQPLWQQSLTAYTSEVEHAWTNWLQIDQTSLSEQSQHFYQAANEIHQQLTDESLTFDLLALWSEYNRLIN